MKTDNDKFSTAVLRITSQKKSVDDIILKTTPTRYFIKGELYSKRNPKSRIREENMWLLESGLENKESLETHISQLLSFIKDKSDVLTELQLESEIDIVCSFSSGNGQGGFTLDHELLKELTKNVIDLVVNLYPPERQ